MNQANTDFEIRKRFMNMNNKIVKSKTPKWKIILYHGIKSFFFIYLAFIIISVGAKAIPMFIEHMKIIFG